MVALACAVLTLACAQPAEAVPVTWDGRTVYAENIVTVTARFKGERRELLPAFGWKCTTILARGPVYARITHAYSFQGVEGSEPAYVCGRERVRIERIRRRGRPLKARIWVAQ